VARICIITPGALGSNPRVVKEAGALHDQGHSVHVISTRTLDLVDERDADVLDTAPWSSERIDLRSRWAWRARRMGQITARMLNRAAGLEAAKAHSAMAPVLAARAREHPADLYIAHYVAALPAAALAARRHGGLYAFDAEDYHLGDLPDRPEFVEEKRLIRSIEGRWLPGCAYVTTASPGIAAAYHAEYGIPLPTTVLNVFPRSQAIAAATARGAAQPGPSVYWVSQTIGPDRGLEAAVEAVGVARSRPHLYLRGALAEGFGEVLQRLAKVHGAAGRVHLLEPCAPSQMERLAADYDVGLAAETGHTTNRKIALTNKQFVYFLAGLPAVLSDIPAHRTFAVQAPGAVRLFEAESSTALARAFDDLLCDPAGLAQARREAYDLGQARFNWDIEKLKLLACVERALNGQAL
jgi:hypothetical protein